MEIFLLTPNMTVEPKICQDILSWKQSRSGIQIWACKGWNEQMFCQQTDHCTTNFKTSGTKTFITFLHKSVFLQAVAEAALMNITFLNTKNFKKKRHFKNQIYFNSKVLFRSNKVFFCSQYHLLLLS